MLGLVMAVLTSSSPRARERPFTLVVMPDVQYYTDLRHKLFRLYWDPPTDNLTHIYTQQLQWVVSTRHRLNTRAVIFMVPRPRPRPRPHPRPRPRPRPRLSPSRATNPARSGRSYSGRRAGGVGGSSHGPAVSRGSSPACPVLPPAGRPRLGLRVHGQASLYVSQGGTPAQPGGRRRCLSRHRAAALAWRIRQRPPGLSLVGKLVGKLVVRADYQQFARAHAGHLLGV